MAMTNLEALMKAKEIDIEISELRQQQYQLLDPLAIMAIQKGPKAVLDLVKRLPVGFHKTHLTKWLKDKGVDVEVANV